MSTCMVLKYEIQNANKPIATVLPEQLGPGCKKRNVFNQHGPKPVHAAAFPSPQRWQQPVRWAGGLTICFATRIFTYPPVFHPFLQFTIENENA